MLSPGIFILIELGVDSRPFMRIKQIVSIAFVLLAFRTISTAGTLSFTTIAGNLITDQNGATFVDNTAASYFSTLNAAGEGTLGWTIQNNSGQTWTNVVFLGFVDAEIDAAIKGFRNEYGDFVSLGPIAGAPSDAVGATSWQIDEPGYVSGTIFTNFLANTLDNTNHNPITALDDTSLALGYQVGSVAAGNTVNLVLTISRTNIGGLFQGDLTDPNGLYTADGFYLNGYADVTGGAVVQPIIGPEPATLMLELAGFALVLIALKVRK